MRKLKVVCTAYLTVPNRWEVVPDPCGVKVLKIGKVYVDFGIVCLRAEDAELSTWCENSADTEKVRNRITDWSTEIEVIE